VWRHLERGFGVAIEDDVAMLALCERHQAIFIFLRRNFRGVHELEGILDARVEAFAQDSPLRDCSGRDAERAGQVRRQCGFRLVDAQTQIGDAQRHGCAVRESFVDSCFPCCISLTSRYDISVCGILRLMLLCGR